MKSPTLLFCTLLAASAAVAQPPEMPSEDPAVPTEMPQAAPARRPAPAAPAESPAGEAVIQAPGMAIIADQESPIGLYIMPWRNSAAEGGLDRPARLLDDALMPLDPDVFRRQVEYHRALSEHLNKTGRATP